MSVYRCVSCPHTTADHERHGTGACLIFGCTCIRMMQGLPTKVKQDKRLDKDGMLARAKKRGAAEDALERE